MNKMNVSDIYKMIDEIAPFRLAESFDNAGLIIDAADKPVDRVMFSLDLTVEVADEAIEKEVDLLITHHPVLFSGVKRLSVNDPSQLAFIKLLQKGISHIAAHTNWDSAKNGINYISCEKLGLKNHYSIKPAPDLFEQKNDSWDETLGLIRVGNLNNEMNMDEFVIFVKDSLQVDYIRKSPGENKMIKRVAFSSGSGSSLFSEAVKSGADIFITSEIKHNVALDARVLGLTLIEIGHYESEKPSMQYLMESLQQRINPVEYNIELCISEKEKSPLIIC